MVDLHTTSQFYLDNSSVVELFREKNFVPNLTSLFSYLLS